MAIDLRATAPATVASEAQLPANPKLREIATIASKQLRLELEIDQLEAALKEKKAQLRLVQETELVAVMQEQGVKTFTLNNGYAVKVEDFIQASLSEGKMAGAVAWCLKHGHSSVVKDTVTVELPKGAGAKAVKLVEALVEMGYQPERVSKIHTGTFKSLVSECRKKGDKDIPGEDLGVYVGTRAVITAPKKQ